MTKKNIIILVAFIAATFSPLVTAQMMTAQEENMMNSLQTLDPEITQYFPRWKVCEPGLQVHIFESFRSAGFKIVDLDKTNIEVLAVPADFDVDGNLKIINITCGTKSMSAYELSRYCTPLLLKKLSGEISYSSDAATGRTYCYKEIPPEVPVSESQAQAIINYYQPTDVNHAISLSLFEQDLKIGETGFWLRSMFGNDIAGYQFWSSGQAAVELQRPLYLNRDMETKNAIPYLMNFYIGAGYRITAGISSDNTIFSWVPNRVLNGSMSGDLLFGLTLNLPVMPELGVNINARLPFEHPRARFVDPAKWGRMDVNGLMDDEGNPREFISTDGNMNITHIVPIMHSSGNISIFYNWWMDKKRPENYIRAELGISYTEVRELAMDYDSTIPYTALVTPNNVEGLQVYKPNEGMDWFYAKVEYRNQATWPFGASLQISNQTMLGNVWVPLFGNWFLLEMKYTKILRDPRPYEIDNFFMFSPVIRITI